MNVSTYIFGKLSSGYTQYPDDNKKVVFKSAADYLRYSSMIAIRRDGNIVHYIYTREISSGQGDKHYLGLALEFNDVYCTDLSGLFSLFDETLIKIVLNGKIVEFNDNGDIVAKASRLRYEPSEINRISNSLYSAVQNLPRASFKKLPPVNFSIGKNEGVRLTDSSLSSDVTEALKVYNVVNVYRDNDESALDEYSQRLKKLSTEISNLTLDKASLSTELAKVNRQKKRTTVVTFLSIIICLGIVIFISISANLNVKVKALTYQKEQLLTKVEEQSGIISNYTQQNQDLSKQLDATKSELKKERATNKTLSSNISELKDQLSSLNKEKKAVESKILNLQEGLKKKNTSSSSTSTSYSAAMYLSSESLNLSAGEESTLRAYNYGSSLSWESDNTKIATVSSSGVVRGIAAGTTTIWAKGKEYKRCVVTVSKKGHDTSDTSTRTVYSKEFSMRIGEKIVAQLSDGKITSWEVDQYRSSKVQASGAVLTAIGTGKISIWGYIGNTPKLFTVTINK